MSAPPLSILLATTNRGKLAEWSALLAELPIELLPLSTVLPDMPPTIEDGTTFEENALIKARIAAEAAMMVTIAEDAGLEVDALGGRPGVRSARFAKEGATDSENNAALLEALAEIDDGQRAARFRCVVVLLDPWNESEPETVVQGRCEGSIAREPRGAGGFGYDPLFVVAGMGRTMAELSDDEKNRISHRAQAVAALRPRLEALIEGRLATVARAVAER
ncbi:RdgB/HAM1 family non-canonical purine NTP pyrophosphatase [Polyangium aurulentum]|uniref:RdgB/HAM1 family non-canonical purine NTP pyrophosphatase n=1 Tax=Polyangium aurulentum TaxID=2567896 RepID=UPI0010ADF99B|nr:RdgB/HAM1 family non-canonical purine NTP pyrophosphatase [Polyangium aurulentum]UQA60997.1 RdgB/HAM1 family non-canonical purine NTP pyrophosphatase [Polyangium aurulentum]